MKNYGLKAMLLLAGPLLPMWHTALYANEVEIVQVVFSARGGERWDVDTTLLHEDAGWQHYADAWRVVDGKGRELGKRVLYHPHVDEQPFTRSLNLEIPKDVTTVLVEAHDKVHGWSARKVQVDLRSSKGERFRVER